MGGVVLKGKSLVLLVSVLLIAMLFGSGCGKEEVQKEVDNRLTVETVAALKGDIQKEVAYYGSLKGIDEVTLYPKVAARVTVINLREGERVAKGQAIIGLDTTDYESGLASAEAAVAQAEISYENTRKNVERTRLLFEQGAVSAQQMEQAELGLAQANAGLAQARAGLQNARNLLANCQVTSPIDGVVGLVGITQGNMASPQAPVAVVSNLRQLKTTVNVSESDIRFVTLNSPVNVKVSSLANRTFTGKVTSVAPVADARTKAFPVEITVDNQDGLLKSGMFAEVRLLTEKKEGVLTLPRGAVIEKGARRVVFTVDKKSVVHETAVTVGIENRDKAEITKGLGVGDQVIIKGQTLLNDGDRVRLATGGKK